jgi:hypothetical protein
MSVLVCSHKIKWQSPIKVYVLLKKAFVLFALTLAIFAPVCVKAQEPDTKQLTQIAPSSGHPSKTTMSPAYMLALALGVRNVAGPVVRSPSPQKDFSQPLVRRTPQLPADKRNITEASIHSRLPRPTME